MKRSIRTTLAVAGGVVFSLQAQLFIPGADGSDGALNVVENTVVDLSLAVGTAWDTPSPNPGHGVYDAEKWAVVFKYSEVTIGPGATLSFINHPSRAPIVWLVDGHVSIQGTLNLNGQNNVSAPNLSEPGPGGFRGGTHYYTAGIGASAGFGVGGGGTQVTARGYGGSYATAGSSGPAPYGNPSLMPLIGGSGGGGAKNIGGGGAGGGAILIAASQTIAIDGALRANGGDGRSTHVGEQQSGGGSGGGIRLVCHTLAGAGHLSAIGGGGSYPGGLGRIRLERVSNTSSCVVTPDPSVLGLAADATAMVWAPADSPQVKILSIGGEPVPADPLASFGSQGADTVLGETATAQVLVETINVEAESQVKVRVTPRANANYTEIDATVSAQIDTDPLTLHWTAEVPVAIGYSALQVKVVRP